MWNNVLILVPLSLDLSKLSYCQCSIAAERLTRDFLHCLHFFLVLCSVIAAGIVLYSLLLSACALWPAGARVDLLYILILLFHNIHTYHSYLTSHTSVCHFLYHHCHHPLLLLSCTPGSKLNLFHKSFPP